MLHPPPPPLLRRPPLPAPNKSMDSELDDDVPVSFTKMTRKSTLSSPTDENNPNHAVQLLATRVDEMELAMKLTLKRHQNQIGQLMRMMKTSMKNGNENGGKIAEVEARVKVLELNKKLQLKQPLRPSGITNSISATPASDCRRRLKNYETLKAAECKIDLRGPPKQPDREREGKEDEEQIEDQESESEFIVPELIDLDEDVRLSSTLISEYPITIFDSPPLLEVGNTPLPVSSPDDAVASGLILDNPPTLDLYNSNSHESAGSSGFLSAGSIETSEKECLSGSSTPKSVKMIKSSTTDIPSSIILKSPFKNLPQVRVKLTRLKIIEGRTKYPVQTYEARKTEVVKRRRLSLGSFSSISEVDSKDPERKDKYTLDKGKTMLKRILLSKNKKNTHQDGSRHHRTASATGNQDSTTNSGSSHQFRILMTPCSDDSSRDQSRSVNGRKNNSEKKKVLKKRRKKPWTVTSSSSQSGTNSDQDYEVSDRIGKEDDDYSTSTDESDVPTKKSRTYSPIPDSVLYSFSDDDNITEPKTSLTRKPKPRNPGYECLVCGRKIDQLYNIRIHMKEHIRNRELECRICHLYYPSESVFLSHMEKAHQMDVIKTFESSSVSRTSHPKHSHNKRKFACGECRKRFSSKEDLIEHFSIHREKMFKCPECSKLFLYRRTLFKHMEKAHDLDEARFACGLCSKKFFNEEALALHKVGHDEVIGKLGYSLITSEPKHAVYEVDEDMEDEREDFIIACENNYPVRCSCCPQILAGIADLYTHLERDHVSYSNFRCLLCPKEDSGRGLVYKTVLTIRGFIYHMINAHSTPNEEGTGKVAEILP